MKKLLLVFLVFISIGVYSQDTSPEDTSKGQRLLKAFTEIFDVTVETIEDLPRPQEILKSKEILSVRKGIDECYCNELKPCIIELGEFANNQAKALEELLFTPVEE